MPNRVGMNTRRLEGARALAGLTQLAKLSSWVVLEAAYPDVRRPCRTSVVSVAHAHRASRVCQVSAASCYRDPSEEWVVVSARTDQAPDLRVSNVDSRWRLDSYRFDHPCFGFRQLPQRLGEYIHRALLDQQRGCVQLSAICQAHLTRLRLL